MKKISVLLIFCTYFLTLTVGAFAKGIHYRRLQIAVIPLQNLGGSNEYNPIGLRMSENLYSALANIQYISIVERSQLNKIIREQQLSLSGLIDHSVDLGRLAGANTLIVGSFEVQNSMLTLYLRMVDVTSGRVIRSVKKSGPARIANRLINQSTEMLIEKIGYPAKSKPSLKISWQQAKKHIGQKGTVSGTIVSTFDSGKVCFLKFTKHDKKTFQAVIFAKNYKYFPANPAKLYYKKKVEITGIIKLYKKTPEMIIDRPEQVRILK